MSIDRDTRIGPYQIVAKLGEGGMGEVYRARDTKLGRDVALKLLPSEFSQDPDRVSRFTREAQALAALNHPNIAAIYGLDEAGSSQFLVLELIEGGTLADRLKRGALPMGEALGTARQLAEALEAAHEKGIVHRDLKPANIALTPNGDVKVLDFGLARLADGGPGTAGGAGVDVTASPTIANPGMGATGIGVILGTAAYMSPEQARGQVTDKRADIWAFGCVLFEMLSGQQPFKIGGTLSDAIATILAREPDWSLLPGSIPPAIQRVVRRCLQKDPHDRLHDIADARIEIVEAEQAPETRLPSDQVNRRVERWAWGSAVVLLVGIAAAFAWRAKSATPPAAAEMRLQIETPATGSPLEFALSPDGHQIVFVASGDGPSRLWLRSLDRIEPKPIPGTEGASYPFWSADSRSVGFFALSRLYRVDLSGGAPQPLAATPLGRGAAWNADGTILFVPSATSPLLRVPATGGEPTPVTRLVPPRQTGHRWPRFLPDGRHFLYFAIGTPEESGIYLGSLDGAEPKRLTAAGSAGAYLPPGRLLFLQQGTLVSRQLDVVRGELTGDPVTVADHVGYATAFLSEQLLGSEGFSVADDGRIAYRAGVSVQRALTWFDRTGKNLGSAGTADAGSLLNPELSPDAKRVALTRTTQTNQDVWLMDLVRGGFARLTFDPGGDDYPVWSFDGSRVAFHSNRTGTFHLYVKPSSGAGADDLLLDTPRIKVPQDWSHDGRFLLYYEVSPTTGRDLWALPMTGGDRKPRVIVNTSFDERHGQFSPDGRFVAYATDESGQFEVVVQPFPEGSGKWSVSTSGGLQPRWSANGRELYYVAPDGKLMAASVAEKGSTLDVGAPVPLFATRMVGGVVAGFRAQYAVAPDGRFLILQPAEESGASPITILLNWSPPKS